MECRLSARSSQGKTTKRAVGRLGEDIGGLGNRIGVLCAVLNKCNNRISPQSAPNLIHKLQYYKSDKIQNSSRQVCKSIPPDSVKERMKVLSIF